MTGAERQAAYRKRRRTAELAARRFAGVFREHPEAARVFLDAVDRLDLPGLREAVEERLRLFM